MTGGARVPSVVCSVRWACEELRLVITNLELIGG